MKTRKYTIHLVDGDVIEVFAPNFLEAWERVKSWVKNPIENEEVDKITVVYGHDVYKVL